MAAKKREATFVLVWPATALPRYICMKSVAMPTAPASCRPGDDAAHVMHIHERPYRPTTNANNARPPADITRSRKRFQSTIFSAKQLFTHAVIKLSDFLSMCVILLCLMTLKRNVSRNLLKVSDRSKASFSLSAMSFTTVFTYVWPSYIMNDPVIMSHLTITRFYNAHILQVSWKYRGTQKNTAKSKRATLFLPAIWQMLTLSKYFHQSSVISFSSRPKSMTKDPPHTFKMLLHYLVKYLVSFQKIMVSLYLNVLKWNEDGPKTWTHLHS